MISAKVIAHSKHADFGNEIITFEVVFPRYILAELNTHRMLSKNSASSRAIKFEKLLESVRNNPFIPVAWMKDHTGMQGHEYITDSDLIDGMKQDWLTARTFAINTAIGLSKAGLTKQLVNRLLEPFMWHKVLITATELENFFHLRCPQYKMSNWIDGDTSIYRSKKDVLNALDYEPIDSEKDLYWRERNSGMADIHMMDLAEAMWDAKNESTPQLIKAGEWHIPYGDTIGQITSCIGISEARFHENELTEKIKVATARCARTSYTVVGDEGKAHDYEADIKLHDRLASSGHWSPFEHCAKAMTKEEAILASKSTTYMKEECWSGNFRGFVQYRKMFANENKTL